MADLSTQGISQIRSAMGRVPYGAGLFPGTVETAEDVVSWLSALSAVLARVAEHNERDLVELSQLRIAVTHYAACSARTC